MKIGIGITTHNRNEVFYNTLNKIKSLAPKEFPYEIITIDDASTIPVEDVSFRFNENVGIAKAKNKCFELLHDLGCTEFFLFDDDCYPTNSDWYKPYIDNKEPHLMYIFKDFSDGVLHKTNKLNDTLEIYKDSNIKAYSHARGCMLYFNKVCLDTVGGMNPNFGKWGFEHSDLSQRIYNSGLTTFKFMDVIGSENLFHSLDEHLEIKSTTEGMERVTLLNKYRGLFLESKETTCYWDFRSYEANKEDIFITVYTTGVKDTQRDVYFKADKNELSLLINSLNGQKLIVLNDCFNDGIEDNVEYVSIESSINPYFQRWVAIRNYLIHNKNKYGRVFIMDGTDVKLLNNPFNRMKSGNIYVGDEEDVVGNQWMINNHRSPTLLDFFEKYKNEKLLNAGLLGGAIEDIIKFIGVLLDTHFNIESDSYFKGCDNSGIGDMGLFNYVCYIHFKEKIRSGRTVNTPFKKYHNESVISWFAHK